ncbi:lytic transglycosylase domain-containing protein [Streptomyces sp. NPDC046862]|uniref:lytic transglycosylase domain-containing protein n=1 Tax=Streptomyces sp. NPDC046862 TaxID=3154603 RepID=UPI003454A366
MTGRRRATGTKTGTKGTVIAVAAMVALTASQAPGAVAARAAEPGRTAPAERGPSVSGDAPYRTVLPPLPPLSPLRPRTGSATAAATVTVGGALPETVFAAYRRAEAELARTVPRCRLRRQLLAAIGQVESGQARGGRVAPDGTTVTPILGPRLDGGPFAVIRDSDGGAYDGDTVYDRVVGPMQFVPSTWAVWGADGNGDGRADPHNVYDAALAAGRYLCAGGRDLSDPGDLDRAILGYNHSQAYLRTVRAWFAYFLEGLRVVPDAFAAPGAASGTAPDSSPPGPRLSRGPRPDASAGPTADANGSGGRGGSGSPSPSSTPSPSPSPSPTQGSAAPTSSAIPQLPLPEPDIDLPDEGLPPATGPLTGADASPMPIR